MSSARLVAIGFIFLCSTLAWFVLGGTIVNRTGESDGRLEQETVGAVLTLFVLMQVTGRVDWDQVFAKRPLPGVASNA